jgi:hypothetical protein
MTEYTAHKPPASSGPLDEATTTALTELVDPGHLEDAAAVEELEGAGPRAGGIIDRAMSGDIPTPPRDTRGQFQPIWPNGLPTAEYLAAREADREAAEHWGDVATDDELDGAA